MWKVVIGFMIGFISGAIWWDSIARVQCETRLSEATLAIVHQDQNILAYLNKQLEKCKERR